MTPKTLVLALAVAAAAGAVAAGAADAHCTPGPVIGIDLGTTYSWFLI